MENQTPSPKFAENLYDNVFEIWANSEIERRKVAGEVPDDYKPWAVQVFMEPTLPNQVRFDDEANGVFHLDPSCDIPDGEQISPLNFHEIVESIVAFELSEDDSLNAGHITLIRHQKGFYITFDFHYNSARIADHVKTAREFMDGASLSLDRGQLRVFTANLFQAVELLAKSSLFKLGHKSLITSNSHKHIRSQYNLHSRSGVTNSRYAPLFNKLFDLRNKAKYPDSPFSLDTSEAEEMLTMAEEMFEAVLARSHPHAQRLIEQE